MRRQKMDRNGTSCKRIAAIFLMACMVSLAGCAAQKRSEGTPETSDSIPVISIENITLSGKNAVTEKIEEQVNAITVPAIGCQVKIVDCPIAEHEDLLKRIQAGMEQVDLMETGLTTSLSALVSSGQLLVLDDLLDTYGQELKAKEGKLLQAATIDGSIYTIPANLYCGRAEGIGYNAAIADRYDLDLSGTMDLARLTEIGRELKEKEAGIYLTTQGDGGLSAFSSFYETETFGSDFDYGVLLQSAEMPFSELAADPGHPVIVNIYKTDAYREYCETLKTWREEGLMPANSMLSGRNGQDMFNHGETFFQYSSVSPGTEIMAKRKRLDFEEKFIPITRNLLKTELVLEFAWGISSTSNYPEKAMELLNLLYTNADLSNLLQFGREGAEYEKVGENVIRLLPAENGTGYSTYFSPFGDSALQYRYETDADVTVEDIRQNAARSQILPTFGYVFNAAEVVNELAEVRKVTAEYRPVLETGMAENVDLFLEEFNQKLTAAGIDRIIAENQRQLDQWLESQS